MERMSHVSRLRRWDRAMELPLTGIGLLFLTAYAAAILDVHIPRGWVVAFDVVTWASWGVFVVDYLVRVGLSDHRKTFVGRHLVDLAIVVLPMLRPLRLLRVLAVLHILNRRAGASLRGRVGLYVGTTLTLVLFVGSLTMLKVERDAPGANIRTFGGAVWWAVETITTVGYGDRYPVTGMGRLVAVGMMIAGVALLGLVTASIASWLLDKVRQSVAAEQTATRRDVERIMGRLDDIERRLEQGDRPQGRAGGDGGAPPER